VFDVPQGVERGVKWELLAVYPSILGCGCVSRNVLPQLDGRRLRQDGPDTIRMKRDTLPIVGRDDSTHIQFHHPIALDGRIVGADDLTFDARSREFPFKRTVQAHPFWRNRLGVG
jgi:hypothetical protein